MAGKTFSQEQVDALVAKLGSIEWSDEERSLLEAILTAAGAAGGEVQGFDLLSRMLDSVVIPTTVPPPTPPSGTISLNYTQTKPEY